MATRKAARKRPTKTSSPPAAPPPNTGELQNVLTQIRVGALQSVAERNAQRQASAAVSEAVRDVDVSAAVGRVTSAGVAVNKALAQVTEQVNAQIAELETLRTAAEQERQRLSDLHGADLIATELSVLASQYEAKTASLEEEYRQKVAALEGTVSEKKAAWADEDAKRQRDIAESEAQRVKDRQREEEEYEYTTQQARRAASDAFDEAVRTKQRNEKIREEDLRRSWERREAELSERESEIQNLREQVASFDDRLTEFATSKVKAATDAISRNHKHELALLKQQTESDTRSYEMQIAQLTGRNEVLSNEVERLKEQVATAYAQVQSIAEKGLDSASGQQALAEMRSFPGFQSPATSSKRS